MEIDNRHLFFRHCPRCGKAATKPPVPGLFDCGACGFHYHLNPASAAAVFIRDRKGRLLWACRANEPHRGMLTIPGGFIDVGETAEETARRETREEVGLELETLEYLGSQVNVYPYREVIYPVTDIFYTSEVESLEAARPLNELTELLLLKPGEVDPNRIAFRSVRAGFEVYRRKYAV